MPGALEIPSIDLPSALDIGAVFFFSITGAMVAIRRHYDLVGLFVLALVSGLGGGILRDGIFIQDGPPAAMQDGAYIIAVLAGAVTAACVHRPVERLSMVFLVFDALGTAAYGVVGASKAFEAGLAVPACLFIGVVNAAGSGLIRDVLVREEPLMMKPGQFYVIASMVGLVAFAVFRLQLEFSPMLSAVLSMAVTFSIRMLSVAFDWKTSPVMKPLPPPDDRRDT